MEYRSRKFKYSFIKGMSTDDSVVDEVRTYVQRHSNSGNVVVMLDSDHGKENVLRELESDQFVTEGSYVIVEDTNVNGHPSFPSHGWPLGGRRRVHKWKRLCVF